jgi:hypothetical protein
VESFRRHSRGNFFKNNSAKESFPKKMKWVHLFLLFLGLIAQIISNSDHVLEKRNRVSKRASANIAARKAYRQEKSNIYAEARKTFAKAQQPKSAKQRAAAFDKHVKKAENRAKYAEIRNTYAKATKPKRGPGGAGRRKAIFDRHAGQQANRQAGRMLRQTQNLPSRRAKYVINTDTVGGTETLTGVNARKAVFNSYLHREKKVGNWGKKKNPPKKIPNRFYPHRFNNGEGLRVGVGNEFPMVADSRGYTGGPATAGGNPGQTRVVTAENGKTPKFQGVMAHPPSPPGGPHSNTFVDVPQSYEDVEDLDYEDYEDE